MGFFVCVCVGGGGVSERYMKGSLGRIEKITGRYVDSTLNISRVA